MTTTSSPTLTCIARFLGTSAWSSFFDEHVGKIMKVVDELGLGASTDIIYTSDHGDNLGSRGLWGKSTMYEEIAGVPSICAGPSFPVAGSHRTGQPRRCISHYPRMYRRVVRGRR